MIEEFWNSNKIADRYENLGPLGAGGIGTVFKAKDKALDKVVAIKILSTNLTAEQSIKFQQEAKLSGKLNHPNIVAVYDFGLTEKNMPYLVMEFLPGRSLQEIITTDGAIEISDAVSIFLSICDGMSHSHDSNILHRDLKPSNIILAEREDGTAQPIIVDFGIARLKEKETPLTQSGSGAGTPLYRAPEQAEGIEIDERADIYSMGCLMYAALSANPPFVGETAVETAMLHKTKQAEKLSETCKREFPPELEAIVEKCLNKDTEQRYRSFTALKDDLQNVYESVPQQESSLATSVPAGSRAGLLSIIIVGVAIVGFGAFILFSSFPRQEPKPVGDTKPPKIDRIDGVEALPHESTITRFEIRKKKKRYATRCDIKESTERRRVLEEI